MKAPVETGGSIADTVRGSLAYVAATGLPGSRLTRPTEPLSEGDFAALLSALGPRQTGRGLSGLLVEAVDAGTFPVTDSQRKDLVRIHEERTRWALHAQETLLVVASQLDAPPCVVGESASAYLDYRSLRRRPFRDVHLLLPSSQFDVLAGVLRPMGFRPSGREVQQNFARRYGSTRRFVLAGLPDVFLHRTLVGGPYGARIGERPLHRQMPDIEIAGQRLRTLDPEARILQTAFTIVLSRLAPVVALRDLAEMVLFAPYDADRLRALAREWGCQLVLARAVDRAWIALAIADVLAISRWASRYPFTNQEPRLIDLYTTPQSSYFARGAATVRELRGLREKIGFIRAIGLPQQSFLEPRKVSRTGWVLRGATRAVSGRRYRPARRAVS